MAKKKSEGEAVRLAYDGPSLDHDELISEAEARNREDAVRASSAGESRNKIKSFLDETNMNSKAFSWMRSVLKTPDVAKAMDIVLSLEAALPMVKAHLGGQQSSMDLEAPAVEPYDPTADVQQFAAPSYPADFDPSDDTVDVDADDFEAALAAAAE